MTKIDLTDTQMLAMLAERLNRRGTKLSRGIYHQKAKGCWWYTEAVRDRNRRDWRDVVRRWLRRHACGQWHVGGHHVGRPDGGPAIGERSPGRIERAATALRVDGHPVLLEVIR